MVCGEQSGREGEVVRGRGNGSQCVASIDGCGGVAGIGVERGRGRGVEGIEGEGGCGVEDVEDLLIGVERSLCAA